MFLTKYNRGTHFNENPCFCKLSCGLSWYLFITTFYYYPFCFLYLQQAPLAGLGSFPGGVTHSFITGSSWPTLHDGSELFVILPTFNCSFSLTLIIGLGKPQEMPYGVRISCTLDIIFLSILWRSNQMSPWESESITPPPNTVILFLACWLKSIGSQK